MSTQVRRALGTRPSAGKRRAARVRLLLAEDGAVTVTATPLAAAGPAPSCAM